MQVVRKTEKTVQSVDRTLSILEIMANYGRPMTLSEISGNLNLKISTAHRLLKTLIIRGFADQDPYTGKYQLGIKTFRIGNTALYSLDIRSVARPYLKELVRTCSETVNLAVLDNGYVVYIDQVESEKMIKMIANLGSRAPSHCNAVGKVMLADLTELDLERFMRSVQLEKYTEKTITAPNKLREELKKVKKSGYALDMEETELGIRCVAAPVYNHRGKVSAAVGISGPTTRVSIKYLEELKLYVKKTASEISQRLGHS